MVNSQDRILLLAPHPDDIEFSCGASVKKWSEIGADIWYIAFSPCNKSLKKGFENGTLYKELQQSVSYLGIPDENVITFNYEVRTFPTHRQEILEDLILLRKKIKPTLVVLPNSNDIHQDHHQVYLEGCRAYKNVSILGYELIWNTFEFKSNVHVVVEEHHLDAKVKAIAAYKSQGFRNYSDEGFIKGLARARGQFVHRDYAECFEAIHLTF